MIINDEDAQVDLTIDIDGRLHHSLFFEAKEKGIEFEQLIIEILEKNIDQAEV